MADTIHTTNFVYLMNVIPNETQIHITLIYKLADYIIKSRSESFYGKRVSP
jgi:hypothetical protein